MGQGLPRSPAFEVEGLRFIMVHDMDDLPAGLSGVDEVVTGHSRRYVQREEDGVLWLNPGGCGRGRLRQEITFAAVEADDGRYRVEKHVVPQAAAIAGGMISRMRAAAGTPAPGNGRDF
ncbi:MAG TPA: metallophosphoesterase family protein [Candidatus Fimivivens faecavium]|nr:metallophosphoesterase family protein [Candidatus Fimivivens faecavium]